MMYPLYSSHAHLWPLLAPVESYEAEMMEWVEIIESTLGGVERLLDFGSGGGHHLYHLAQHLEGLVGGVAVDASEPMLERLTSILPNFETRTEDMTRLDLDERFPLVTVHDSFCYLTSLTQVEELFGSIARHLTPKGLALIKVDALADSFRGPYRYLTDFDDGRTEVTLTHYEWDPDPTDTEVEVIYVFLERVGQQVECREERHRLGLFKQSQLVKMANRCGFLAKFHQLERWDEDRENPLLILRSQ